MAGKTNKTRVTLPGSLADLVRDLQDGGAQGVRTSQEPASENARQDESRKELQTLDSQEKTKTDRVGEKPSVESSNADNLQSSEAQEGTSVKPSVRNTAAHRRRIP